MLPVAPVMRMRLEDMLYPLADSFDDLACSLHRAFANVFGAFTCACADGCGAVDRVKRHHVTRALRDASGDISGASRGSLPDVARAAADLAARASGFLFGFLTFLRGLIRR